MKRLPTALACLAALALLPAAPAHAASPAAKARPASAAATAGPRDEALARRLMHCANVAEVWAEFLQQKGDGTNSENQVKVRNLFVAAAETAADADYTTKYQPTAFADVKALLARQEKEKKDLLTPETASCTETFKTKAMPLLQKRAAANAAAASAASAAAPAPAPSPAPAPAPAAASGAR